MYFPWHLYVMALLYVLAGMNHFRNPKMYVKIIPDYLPNKKLINLLSGLLEIILGISLCIPAVSNFAAWGIIVMLILFYMTHFFMIQNKDASFGLPKWILWLRLLLQIGLMYWAYQYT